LSHRETCGDTESKSPPYWNTTVPKGATLQNRGTHSDTKQCLGSFETKHHSVPRRRATKHAAGVTASLPIQVPSKGLVWLTRTPHKGFLGPARLPAGTDIVLRALWLCLANTSNKAAGAKE